jgi:hypothetical protein
MHGETGEIAAICFERVARESAFDRQMRQESIDRRGNLDAVLAPPLAVKHR